jgi:hypothetical protein
MPPRDTVRRLKAGDPITEGWTGEVVDGLVREHAGANMYVDGSGVYRRPDPRTAAHDKIELCEIQPDTGKRYGTANARGVFDGKIVTLDPPESGDVREEPLEKGDDIWIWALRHRPEALIKVTYSSKVGTFTPGEYVTQEVEEGPTGSGASGWLLEDDGTDLYIHLEEGSVDFEAEITPGDRTITGADSGATAEVTAVSVVAESLDEEKVNLLPAWDVYKGLYVGLLDVSGDERELYAVDEAPTVRQFEVIDDDFIQNADESWPFKFKAELIDEPGNPEVWIYLPGEGEIDYISAYYPGLGRKGATWVGPPAGGHKGSFGFAKWSEIRKRWEYIDGCFKIYAVGVTQEASVLGDRVTVEIYWRTLASGFGGMEASGCQVEAFNYYYEQIESGDRVTISFDRQENLWYITDVEAPVMVEGIDSGIFEAVGKITLEDANPYSFTYNYPITFQKDPVNNHVVIVGVTGPDALTVKETDDSPTVQRVSVLMFDSGDFVVTDNGGGSVTVSLADGLNLGGNVGFGGNIALGNSQEIQLGDTAGGDGQIYHDGSDFVFNVDTGGFVFSGNLGIGTIPSHQLHLYRNDTSIDNNSLIVEQDGSGDASIRFLLTATRAYKIGIDNSDGDKFKISEGQDSLGIDNWFSIEPTGNVALPNNSQELQFGATSGGDGQISHDGSDFVFNADTGRFSFTGGKLLLVCNDTTVASFDGSTGAYARISINSDANADAQLSFQENWTTKWTIGNDGTDDTFQLHNAIGAFDGTSQLVVTAAGFFGFNEQSPTCPVHAKQASTTAAIPVQTLEQADVDEPFLKVIGTAAAADLTRSIVDNGDVTTPTLAGWVKIEVQDDGNQITDQDYFIPVYTLA